MRHQHVPVLERVRGLFGEILEEKRLRDAEVSVRVVPLTPEEAIGRPARPDFPIVLGKERVIEASVLGARGQAFTDSPAEFEGTLQEVLRFGLKTSQERAVFIASLNAALRHLGLVQGTVHCKDEDPERCAVEIADVLSRGFGEVPVGLIGLNPAIAQRLVERFGVANVRITDLDPDNVGGRRFGVEIWDGSRRTEELVDASPVVVFPGTTLVNGTFDGIWELIQTRARRYLVYGMTAAGVCQLMGIERVCPCGRDN